MTKAKFKRIFLAFLILLPTAALAASPTWDRAANIQDAAKRLGALHRREGSQGVLKFLDACYRTHTLASQFNRGLEACMAQDYMHSQVLAVIYARVPQEARAKLNAPSPELIAQSMSARFAAVFSQYNLTSGQTGEFKKSVDTHGIPIFLKAVFPKGAPTEAEKK